MKSVTTPNTRPQPKALIWSSDSSPENGIIEGVSLFRDTLSLPPLLPLPQRESMYILYKTSEGTFCFTEAPDYVTKLDNYTPKSLEELSMLIEKFLVCLKYQWPHVVDETESGKTCFVLWDDQVFIAQQRLIFSKEETKGCLKLAEKFASCILRMYIELLPSDCQSVADLAIRFFWSLNTESIYELWENKVWWYIFPKIAPEDFGILSRTMTCEELDPPTDIQFMRDYLRIYISYFPEGEDYESDDEGMIDFDLDKYSAFKKQVSLTEWSNDEYGDRMNSAFHKFTPPYFDAGKRCRMENIFAFQNKYCQEQRGREQRIRFHEIIRELIVIVDPQVDREHREELLTSLLEDFVENI